MPLHTDREARTRVEEEGRSESSPYWRWFFLALPSFVLVFWAALVQFDVNDKTVTVLMFLALAASLCKEEHVRHKGRKNQ